MHCDKAVRPAMYFSLHLYGIDWCFHHRALASATSFARLNLMKCNGCCPFFLSSATYWIADAPPGALTAARTNSNRRHNLTYGEVLPESIEIDVLPHLGELGPDDVFYDLGSGTGKIPLQVALQTRVGRSKGVEFARSRHDAAKAAYARLKDITPGAVETSLRSKSVRWEQCIEQHSTVTLPGAATRRLPVHAFINSLADLLACCRDRVECIHGDFCAHDLSDATVIFINNAVFEADLMLALLKVLETLPRLRRVVCLRKLCYRHRARCSARGEPCVAFGHPIAEATVNVRTLCSTSLLSLEVQSSPKAQSLPAERCRTPILSCFAANVGLANDALRL